MGLQWSSCHGKQLESESKSYLRAQQSHSYVSIQEKWKLVCSESYM